MTTSVPSSCGDVRDGQVEGATQGALPGVRRRVRVGRPDLVREQARLGHLVGVGDLGDHRVDRGVIDAGLVEVAQVADERHHTHRRDHPLPRLCVHAPRQPAREPLPRDAGLGERGRTALAQQRAPLVDRYRVERRRRRQHRQHVRVGDRVVVVTTVEEVLEQRRLDRGAWRRVRELEHVGHPDLTAQAVVAQRGALRVEAARGVGDTALHRHRDLATVGRQPVAEHLCRLVGALECTRDGRATTRATRGDVLRRHHERGRPHQHRLAQVLHEPDLARVDVGTRDERRIRGRDLANELDEARVAIRGTLVERVLADHVGHREQEEIRLGVARVPDAALVRQHARVLGADRRVQVGAEPPAVGARELGHVVRSSCRGL